MRSMWWWLLLLAGQTAWAAVAWAPAPDVYKLLPDGSVEARDGGQSTSDFYLLTQAEYREFVLEFEVTRLAELGEKPRSLLTWALDPATPANRKAFFMDFAALRLGQKARVRLVVMDDQAAVYVDGKLFATNPTVYGTPLAAGRVGFLHYYNYAFRYSALKLTPLTGQTLPAPTGLRAQLTPAGVLHLTWEMPELYANLTSFRLYRVAGTTATAEPRHLLARPPDSAYQDPTLRSGGLYSYVVTAVTRKGEEGPASRPATVRTGKLRAAPAPTAVTATQRLDGAVRVRWHLPPEARLDGIAVYRGQTQEEALGARAESVAARLPAGTDSMLAPRSGGKYYAVATLDPDGGTSARVACPITSHAPLVQPLGKVPSRHPYLLYSADQITRARQLIAGEDWARKAAEGRRRSADGYCQKPPEIPREPVDTPYSLTPRFQDVALAYQLLGDEKYAQWVRDGLVGYAQVYPKLPVRGGRVRLAKTVSGLYEAMWFVPLVIAYDLVYESPAFSRADHELIQRDLMRPGAELFWVKDYHDPGDVRPADLHYRCYNFQAWFDCAVGLAGLVLQDADMVEAAIDGPYGFKHLLAHDVHDDGVFWERSFGYQSFVLQALFPLLQAAYHCNLDLWALTVPDNENTDRLPLANYCVGDGDNGPKSMSLLLDGPFYATFPDLSWPVMADSGRGPLSPQVWHRVGWERLQNPRCAWLLNRGAKPAATYGGVKDAGAQIRLAYDEKHLYLAARLADQVVRNSHATPDAAWAGDALWVGLKWSSDQTPGYDFIYGLSPGDLVTNPPLPVLFTRFGAPANLRSAARLAAVKSEDGYHLEAAIPLSEFVPQAGEKGSPLTPAEGLKITADFVIYDSDQATGATTKEKMLGWACTTDRYEAAQGGSLFFGPSAPEAEKTINAPRVTGLEIDGKLGDWENVPARQARLGEKSALMTDAGSAGPDVESLFYPASPREAGSFDLKGEKFANNGLLEAGCSLFPSTGFALLRDRLDDQGLGHPDATCVNLTYGPYGGGHGHPDKLSLVVYARGQHLIPDFGSCDYDSVEKGQWTAQTIGHNTVVVDQTSQLPTGDREVTWPCDSAEQPARGTLECFHGDPLLKIAQAADKSTYPGVEQRRAVAIMQDQVFDFFQLTSPTKRTYDYTLHLAVPLQSASQTLTALPDPLGARLGYQHVHQARGSQPTGDLLETVWAATDHGLRLTMAPVAGTQLIVAQGITTALDKPMPMQILRRQAAATTFATVMQPVKPGRRPPDWTWSQGANALGAADSQGAFVAWSPNPRQAATVGAIRFAGTMVAGQLSGEAGGVSLVQGTALQAGQLLLSARQPVSLYVRLNKGRPVELVAGYDSRGPVALTYGGRTQTLTIEPRQVYHLSQ